MQIINRPKRYIGRECLDEMQISFENLRKYYEEKDWMVERIDKLEYDLKLLKKMTPYAAINFIRHGIGYEEYLTEYAQYRRIKPEELYEVLNELQETARNFPSYDSWFAHMEEYAATLRQQAGKLREEHAVTFTTLHSAKGLGSRWYLLRMPMRGTCPTARRYWIVICRRSAGCSMWE